MALAPTAALTRRAARSNAPYALLAAAYGLALAASWAPDTLSLMMPGSLSAGLSAGWNPQFFPSLAAISDLLARPLASASFLLHVAFINLFAARAIYNHGAAVFLKGAGEAF